MTVDSVPHCILPSNGRDPSLKVKNFENGRSVLCSVRTRSDWKKKLRIDGRKTLTIPYVRKKGKSLFIGKIREKCRHERTKRSANNIITVITYAVGFRTVRCDDTRALAVWGTKDTEIQ